MVFESAGLSLYEPGRRNPERSWDPCQGGFGIRSPANGRNRRILPVPGRAREGLFTAATADISLGEAATARFASKPASQTRRRCRPLARAHKLADPRGSPRRRLGTLDFSTICSVLSKMLSRAEAPVKIQGNTDAVADPARAEVTTSAFRRAAHGRKLAT